jgi:diaminopimelate epimerase
VSCVPFAKAHALGNDFLLVAQSRLGGCLPGTLAQRACDRHSGVGADGLVLLGEGGADVSFRIFNSDGSEAGLSGNALRCAAAWLVSRREADAAGNISTKPGEAVAIETRVGVRRLFFVRRDEQNWIFRAETGVPGFAAAGVPFHPPGKPAQEPITEYPLPVGDEIVRVAVLSMGNPQCIVFVDDFDSVDWPGLGADIESHPYFPERTNVGFARVLGRERIEARFWERGAGHTLASGTGSCACAVAAHVRGKTERRVTVQVERGEVEVNWREDGMVEHTGPAAIVAEGELYV